MIIRSTSRGYTTLGVVQKSRVTRGEIMWNFFEFGHEKGKHDGAGATVKQALTLE